MRTYKVSYPHHHVVEAKGQRRRKKRRVRASNGRQFPDGRFSDGTRARRWLGIALMLSGSACTFLVAFVSSTNLKTSEQLVRGVHRHLQDSLEITDELFGEASGDHFGSSIAMASNGRKLAVGARYHGAGAHHDSGRAEVYGQQAMVTSQVGQTIDGERIQEHFGGSVAISGSSDHLAVAGKGNIRIYQLISGRTWNKTATIQLQSYGQCGLGRELTMSEDGNKLVLATAQYDGTSCKQDYGDIITYTWRTRTGWKKAGKLVSKAVTSLPGYSLAMTPNGRCLVVGQPGHDNDTMNPKRNATGATSIYKWVDARWVRKGRPILGKTENERSGSSIAVSSDCSRVVSGAPYNNLGGEDAGRVTTYDYDETTDGWVADNILGGVAHDLFGTSVDLSSDGTRLAVGAIGSTPIGNPDQTQGIAQPGYAQIFDWTGTGWEQYGVTVNGAAPFDQFGYKVLLSPRGDRMLISSLLRDSLGRRDAGSVQILALTPNHLPCPISDVELASEVCESQVPHSDGGLCSFCQRNLDCLGGGERTYCNPDQYCVPLEQVGPGCRCQHHRDCFGYEDRIHVCHHSTSSIYPEPFASLFARQEGSCLPVAEAI